MTQQHPGDHPGEFPPPGEDEALRQDLAPRRIWRIAPVTAVLLGVVLLAAGATGGVAAHAALADDSNQAGGTGGQGGQGGQYPGFPRGQGAPGGQDGQGPGAATIGTVESVSDTTMKVKRQDGTVVTVTLTPSTDIQVTKKGSATDLTKGSTVAVTGTGDGTSVTAQTVRQGDLFGGFGGRRPSGAPSQPSR